MTNQEGAVLDDFVDRAIENLVQGLAGRMTHSEAKRAVRDGLLRGIDRMNVPDEPPMSGKLKSYFDRPTYEWTAREILAGQQQSVQPMDESGFSAGFGVGND